jgi:TM2 domain-containing membrane protein YozV
MQPAQVETQQAPAQHQQMQAAPVGQTTVISTAGGAAPSVGVAYLLWFFLGFFGAHHLYMGRGIGIWILSVLTLQGLGIWWFVDLFLIPGACANNNNQTIIVAQ